jgi:GT2 family glycosyltransferase
MRETLAKSILLATEEGVRVITTRHLTRGFTVRLYRHAQRRGGGYVALLNPDVPPDEAAIGLLRLVAMVSPRGWSAYASLRRAKDRKAGRKGGSLFDAQRLGSPPGP